MLAVYGADFSGAMSPKIFYVYGELDGDTLTLKSYTVCDDRLDLYHAIVQSGDALWGLDFPFSLPVGALPMLGFADRDDMMRSVTGMTRKVFAAFIEQHMQDYPRKCADDHGIYCRATDCAVHAHSVFKTVNPNLRVMLYAGLKMLRYLTDAGINVYPFTKTYHADYARVYEIYPSYAWQAVGLKRSIDIDGFIDRFNTLGHLRVISAIDSDAINNQDLADSVVACVMMATAYVTQKMNTSWDNQLPIFTDDEWKRRHIEGLIVRF